jgi:hypothetical protein
MTYFHQVWNLGAWRLGLTHDLVLEGGEPYLERWILWCGITLRLHKFHKGDDERAFHDHPWWFVTMPLQSYRELTPMGTTIVRRFRPSFRAAQHRHIVQLIDTKPAWTFIITGRKEKDWGFWDEDGFTHHDAVLAAKREN